jgi:DNA methylase
MPDPGTDHTREITVDGPIVPIPRAVIDQADTPAAPPAVSVWATAQHAPATQRKGRYVAESTAHPAKMLPEIAAHAITHYTRPGDLVLDPMCGIGTTLMEAIHLGRRAVGVEYEPHSSPKPPHICAPAGTSRSPSAPGANTPN